MVFLGRLLYLMMFVIYFFVGGLRFSDMWMLAPGLLLMLFEGMGFPRALPLSMGFYMVVAVFHIVAGLYFAASPFIYPTLVSNKSVVNNLHTGTHLIGSLLSIAGFFFTSIMLRQGKGRTV